MKKIKTFNPEKVAKAEIGWWEAHHRKDYDEVIKQMALVYFLLFGLSHKKAKEVVMLRIEAAKEHDLAEKEGVPEQEAKQHWQKATELMTKHFSLLKEALSETE
jgi:hypothetical protein